MLCKATRGITWLSASIAAVVARRRSPPLCRPLPPSAATGVTSVTQLPLSNFGGIAVDAAHQHAFVSSPTDNAVVVTDYGSGRGCP